MAGSLTGFTGTRTGALSIFVARRVLWMIPVVFFVVFITFALMHLAPGSPWDRTGGRQLSASVVHNLDVKYGLDKPIPYQFGLYLWNVVHFDFGLSYQYEGKSVTTLILEGWPYTAPAIRDITPAEVMRTTPFSPLQLPVLSTNDPET